jgi:hypothetical protein
MPTPNGQERLTVKLVSVGGSANVRKPPLSVLRDRTSDDGTRPTQRLAAQHP